jgi:hypothetical protein
VPCCAARSATISRRVSFTARTVRIGTASFSLAGDTAKTVKLDLNATGRALLVSAHGRLRASLAILELAPSPKNTQTKAVRLVGEKVAQARR